MLCVFGLKAKTLARLIYSFMMQCAYENTCFLYLQVFRDMLHNTIDKSCLRGQHELLGKGGFGTVYKVKLYKVIYHMAVVDVYV